MIRRGTPPPGFFVSVADKGLSVAVSGLESTVAGGRGSVDSKGDGCLEGSCQGRRSEAKGRAYLGQAAEWVGWSAVGCWAEWMAQRAARMDVGRRMRLEMGLRVDLQGRARSRQ